MGNGGLTHIVRPVSTVYACNEIPFVEKPAVICAYFDAQQGEKSGIIVITKHRIENYSSKYGHISYTYKMKNNVEIRCAEYTCNSAFGAVVFLGCTDLCIHVHDNVKLKELCIFSYFNGSNTDMLSSNLIRNDSNSIFCSLSPAEAPSRQAAALTNADAESSSETKLSAIMCPLNNAIICGFCDGSLKSFFLEKKEVACVYKPSAALSCFIYEKSEHHTTSLIFSPTAVRCISFCKRKNYIVVGYSQEREITRNKINTAKNYSVITNVPIVVYALENAKFIKAFTGSTNTILNAYYTDDLRYLIACTCSNIYIWNGDEEKSIIHTFCFCKNLTLLKHYNLCLNALIISKEGVVLATFDSNCFICIHISLPHTKSWGFCSANYNTNSNNTNINHECNKIVCTPTKLFQMRENDITNSELKYSALKFIWYESKTETVVLGGLKGVVKLVPDIFRNRVKSLNKSED